MGQRTGRGQPPFFPFTVIPSFPGRSSCVATNDGGTSSELTIKFWLENSTIQNILEIVDAFLEIQVHFKISRRQCHWVIFFGENGSTFFRSVASFSKNKITFIILKWNSALEEEQTARLHHSHFPFLHYVNRVMSSWNADARRSQCSPFSTKTLNNLIYGTWNGDVRMAHLF